MNLKTLDLGAPAAERDKTLKDYFVESDAYKRVRDGKKYLLLGNRGSGKSAIFKVLAERQVGDGNLVVELAPEDYSYEMLKATLRTEQEGSWAKHGAYTVAWKYILYIEIMKSLNVATNGLKTGATARIYNYLRDHIKGEQGNPIGLLISFLKRLEGIKIASYEAKAKTSDLESMYKLEEITKLIPDIVELCSKRRLYVMVDELDKGWDSSEDAKDFIAGLVQAANTINQHSPNLRIVVSLRQELYDSIPALYDDAQKYRDVMEFLVWDENSLLHLIAERIRHGAPELSSQEDLQVWNSVFPESLDFRKSKPFNYLVDRTLYRPREIIQFVTDTIAEANSSGSNEITYQTISTAEMSYSKARTQDIAAEYKFQYPGLAMIFESFRGKNYSFTRSEMETLLTEVSLNDKLANSAAWANLQDPDFLLDVLWRVGFIRAYAVGGIKARRRSGSQYVSAYQIENLDLKSMSRFQVHPMFRIFLSMKEGKGSAEDE
jgi:energy-coupling factor transporter ATP-binding protein EcfA2